MYVEDPARPTVAGWAAPPVTSTPSAPAAEPERVAAAPQAPWSAPGWRAPDARPRTAGRERSDGLSQRTGRLIAGAFAVAWILCPTIEPMPSGPMPDYPLWQLPIDLATLGSIIAAVVVLWRGGRHGSLLGFAAGAFMLLETIMCPIAGHTDVGWWTWTQTGLSLLVLGISAALLARPSETA
jgi:hypothetical protein